MLVKPKNVIISVKPEYATKILCGEKTVELRRKFPLDHIEGGIAIIYASSPIKKIIGYARIDRVCELPIDLIWKKYHSKACVNKSFMYSYFDGLSTGFALLLSTPITLKEPLNSKSMKDEFSLTAPQSFRYAPDEVIDRIAA